MTQTQKQKDPLNADWSVEFKKEVTEVMQLAKALRHAPIQNDEYDDAYRRLQDHTYTLLHNAKKIFGATDEWLKEANRLLIGMFREDDNVLRSMWGQDLKKHLAIRWGEAAIGNTDIPNQLLPKVEPKSSYSKNHHADVLRMHVRTLRLAGQNDSMVEDLERAAQVLDDSNSPPDSFLSAMHTKVRSTLNHHGIHEVHTACVADLIYGVLDIANGNTKMPAVKQALV